MKAIILVVKKILSLLTVLVLVTLTGCFGQPGFPNSTQMLFYEISYPDGFLLSAKGDSLRLNGEFKIILDGYRYPETPEKAVESTIASLSGKLGGNPVTEDFSVNGFEGKRLSLSTGNLEKVAYVFWNEGWLGVVGSESQLDAKQSELLGRIARTVKMVNQESQIKQWGPFENQYFAISIPQGWSGSVQNHFELDITYTSISQGVGKFTVYVINNTAYKTIGDWAADFIKEMKWTPKSGNMKIGGVNFLTFVQSEDGMTTRIYCTIHKGLLAVMSYTVSSPAVEKEAMEIAKGLRFK
jgi:hypothetical protein